MTRRQTNARRLTDAARAAVVADDWIGGAKRASALAAMIGEHDAARYGEQLRQHERVRRRLPGKTSQLVDVFSAYPALGGWCQSPDTLVRLIRFAGAALSGGSMTRVVNRAHVSQLIASLGEDVWRYGVERGDMGPAIRPVPDDIVATIEDQGCSAVFAFLDLVAPGLAVDAFEAAGIDVQHLSPPQEPHVVKQTLQAIMERAAP